MPNYSGRWNLPTQMQAVAAGTWTGIALAELYAWGNNNNGNLGLGDTTTRSSPTQVGSLTTWATTNSGGGHNLATTDDGKLYAWGYNIYGGLGLGDTVNRSSPVQVGALTTWNVLPQMEFSRSSVVISSTTT